MGIISELQNLERLQFFKGQRLLASDIQAVQAFNREMRWLHNQSLHQPGIGMGFSVNLEVGDREVTVVPGYAIDSLGREIVLPQKSSLPIPSVSDDGFGNPVNYDLAVSYPEDRLLNEAETKRRITLSNEAMRLRDEPRFHWIELDQNVQPIDDNLKADIKNGMKIVIKRVAIQNCSIKRVLTDLEPRKAHAEKPVYIFAGETNPANTEWEFWTESTLRVGLKAFVNTSSAEFNYTPRYFARVSGERFVPAQISSTSNFMVDGFLNITERAEKGFTLAILMPEIVLPQDVRNLIPVAASAVSTITLNPRFDFFGQEINEVRRILKEIGWHIVWMGIEE